MILLSNFMEFLCSNIFLTGYISGNNTFPKPLDEKEEEKYLHEDGNVIEDEKTLEEIKKETAVMKIKDFKRVTYGSEQYYYVEEN